MQEDHFKRKPICRLLGSQAHKVNSHRLCQQESLQGLYQIRFWLDLFSQLRGSDHIIKILLRSNAEVRSTYIDWWFINTLSVELFVERLNSWLLL